MHVICAFYTTIYCKSWALCGNVLVYIGLKGQQITALGLLESWLDDIESVETTCAVSPVPSFETAALPCPPALIHLRWKKNDELLTFTLMEMKSLISIIALQPPCLTHLLGTT